MPVTLTESPVFPEEIVAPVGTDARDLAADTVRAIAQALANRSRYLRNAFSTLQSQAAKLGVSNVFTGIQTIDIASPETPMIRSNNTPATYRLLAEFPVDVGNRRVRIYWGAVQPFIATINARWSGADSKWHRDVNSADSSALIVGLNDVLFSSVLADDPLGAEWSSWPLASTGLGLLRSNRMTTNDLTVTGNALADAFNYRTVAPVDRPIDLAAAYGDCLIQLDGTLKAGPSGTIGFRTRLPRNASFAGVEIAIDSASGSGASLGMLTRRDPPTWSATPSVPAEVVASSANAPVGTGAQRIQLGGVSGVDGLREYNIVWRRNHADDRVLAIRLTGYTEPGLRNW